MGLNMDKWAFNLGLNIELNIRINKNLIIYLLLLKYTNQLDQKLNLFIY